MRTLLLSSDQELDNATDNVPEKYNANGTKQNARSEKTIHQVTEQGGPIEHARGVRGSLEHAEQPPDAPYEKEAARQDVAWPRAVLGMLYFARSKQRLHIHCMRRVVMPAVVHAPKVRSLSESLWHASLPP